MYQRNRIVCSWFLNAFVPEFPPLGLPGWVGCLLGLPSNTLSHLKQNLPSVLASTSSGLFQSNSLNVPRGIFLHLLGAAALYNSGSTFSSCFGRISRRSLIRCCCCCFCFVLAIFEGNVWLAAAELRCLCMSALSAPQTSPARCLLHLHILGSDSEPKMIYLDLILLNWKLVF